MSRIENFIEKVESGRYITFITGIKPGKDLTIKDMQKFSNMFPELHIDPEKELKVVTHARASFNAQNN